MLCRLAGSAAIRGEGRWREFGRKVSLLGSRATIETDLDLTAAIYRWSVLDYTRPTAWSGAIRIVDDEALPSRFADALHVSAWAELAQALYTERVGPFKDDSQKRRLACLTKRARK